MNDFHESNIFFRFAKFISRVLIIFKLNNLLNANYNYTILIKTLILEYPESIICLKV